MLASTSSKALRLPKRAIGCSQARRCIHDIVDIGAKKTVLSKGIPGYSADSGHVVTVFGCTGFLGRYVVAKLAKMGTQVVVPYREEDDYRHLKPMGDLGRIVKMEWDIRNPQQIEECVRHSDIVYNLVGRDYETKNFKYNDVHAKGAELIAKISAEQGVGRFVQLSHLNASHDSKSAFYRSKAEGEELVKAAFPSATIVRPSYMFGYEDKFLNNMAVWPVWWKLNNGETKSRPVHVLDVATVLAKLLIEPPLAGTINLPGPDTLSHAYILELIRSLTYSTPSTAPVLPKPVALAITRIAQAIWWPLVCPDEVERRFIDDVPVKGDWDMFGIEPGHIEQLALSYVRRYRKSEHYALPAVFPDGTVAK